MKALGLVLAVLALVVFPGCGDDGGASEATAVLYEQLELLESEDLAGFLATIHPESPQYSTTRAAIEPVFSLYELDYDLESVEVLEIDEDEARLRAVQVTRKVSGPGLADTRVTALHTMKKISEGWKLYASEIESSEPLAAGVE